MLEKGGGRRIFQKKGGRGQANWMREEREEAGKFCKRRETGGRRILSEKGGRFSRIGREKKGRGRVNFVREWKGGVGKFFERREGAVEFCKRREGGGR